MKHASKAWNAKFTGYLPAIGFQSSHSYPSLFVKHDATNIVMLLLYVDDNILTGSNDEMVQYVINDMSLVFEMKNISKLTYFLGLQASYNKT